MNVHKKLVFVTGKPFSLV